MKRITLGKTKAHTTEIIADGRVVAYLVKHRAMESISYRMVGDPKQHHVRNIKIALAHIERKLG